MEMSFYPEVVQKKNIMERSSAKFRRLASLRSAATSKFGATVVGGVSAGGQLREIRLASAAK